MSLKLHSFGRVSWVVDSQIISENLSNILAAHALVRVSNGLYSATVLYIVRSLSDIQYIASNSSGSDVASIHHTKVHRLSMMVWESTIPVEDDTIHAIVFIAIVFTWLFSMIGFILYNISAISYLVIL